MRCSSIPKFSWGSVGAFLQTSLAMHSNHLSHGNHHFLEAPIEDILYPRYGNETLGSACIVSSTYCLITYTHTQDLWCTSALNNQECRLMTKETSRCVFSQWGALAMKEDMEWPIMLVNLPSVLRFSWPMLDIIPLRVDRSTLVYQNNKGIYNNFCKKKATVLLCTDIAARGLDFSAVYWVLQLNCFQDATNWIHSAGSWRYFVPEIQKWNTWLRVFNLV